MTLSGPTETRAQPRTFLQRFGEHRLLCVSASSLQPVSSRRSQYRFLRTVCSLGAKLSRSLAVQSPLDAI
jgi:hypothetical protein